MVRDWAEHTTIHGPAYIVDKALPRLSNALWFFTFVICGGLAIHLTVTSYTDWKSDQVINTLKDTAKPVTALAFPTLTFCGDGLNMDNVKTTVERNFNQWTVDRNMTVELGNIDELAALYMEETFQITDR